MSFSLARPERLGELREELGGELDSGLRERLIERVARPGEDGDLSLIVAPRLVEAALSTSAVLLCAPALTARLPEGRRWSHPHAEWVLAELLDRVSPPRLDSELPPDLELGPGAVVLPGARIGAGSRIGPNAVVYGNVCLGARVVVGASAVIGRPGFGWVTGPAGRVRRMPQLGGVVIEDDVEIGALSTVDAGTLGPTRVGAGAKLDAHVHVGHNVEIGPGCLIAAQAGFAGSVVLEPGVWVGGQAGVKDHVRVGAGARLAAKSGVIGDVPAGTTVAGYPAVPRLRWLRGMARLFRRG